MQSIAFNYFCVMSSKKNTTIHDIAEALKISASTVSRALNNHPGISVKAKKEVHEMAKKLNYRPNILASQLRKGQSKTIGLVVPRINRFFFADLIAGIEYICNKEEYNLIICQSDESLKKEKQNLLTFLNSQVDGIIISISAETFDGQHLQEVLNRDTPLVQVDRVIADIKSSTVVNDNFTASYNVVKHLIDQGYRRIAHYTGNRKTAIYKERFLGYKQALEDSGIPLDETLVFEGSLTREEGEKTTEKIFSSQTILPDAICSAGDFSAVGALAALKKMHIPISGTIGITGFANEVVSQFTEPAITSVDQFSYEMGITAAKVLIEEIQLKPQKTTPKNIVIAPELKLRESSLKKHKQTIQ